MHPCLFTGHCLLLEYVSLQFKLMQISADSKHHAFRLNIVTRMTPVSASLSNTHGIVHAVGGISMATIF
jgi:hypothetical protein